MTEDMDAIITSRTKRAPAHGLFAAPLPVARYGRGACPARVRLDEAIGPELARRLIASLVAHSRR